MPNRSLEDLHPDLKTLCQQFLDGCHAQGVNVFITQTYRSNAEQDADYAKGRTQPGNVVTNARAEQSPHNWILEDGTAASKAFDFAIKGENGTLDWNANDAAWKLAISIGENLGLVSGSTFHSIKDNPHMELANWKTP